MSDKNKLMNSDITPKSGEYAWESEALNGLGRLPSGWNDKNEIRPYQSSNPVPKQVKDGRLSSR